ncbi:hypothetical protein [Nocardioides alcanivorans]|uniref:hypothetical protein n=1 Tax=Nocardioides alcanivorans TaxID=2897352 RepID=UPI001F3935BF|nr:hypothetical protein [Nocardioides alcanivorans]
MNRPAVAPPAPLVVALSLAAIEGLLLVGYAVLELVNTASGRWVMGLTTAAWFLLCGVGLIVCAVALRNGSSWARSPVVLTQLIGFGVAWSFRGGNTTAVSAALVTVGVIVLIGLLHPQSIDYLSDEEA